MSVRKALAALKNVDCSWHETVRRKRDGVGGEKATSDVGEDRDAVGDWLRTEQHKLSQKA